MTNSNSDYPGVEGQARPPAFGDTIASANPSHDMVRALRVRRSTQADLLGEPGPCDETLRDILLIASRVPDHRRVCPYRFIVFKDEARQRAGQILRSAFVADNPGAEDAVINKEQTRFLRAPIVVAVIATIDEEHRTPAWEQQLTVGAVCQNMLLAANAHGFASQWLTEWYAYDQEVSNKFGLTQNEKIAGFIYIGTAVDQPKERKRPELADLIRYF